MIVSDAEFGGLQRSSATVIECCSRCQWLYVVSRAEHANSRATQMRVTQPWIV
jgi:hypothetical protein